MPILGIIDGSGDTVGTPVIGTAVAGNTRANVNFTPPTSTGKGGITYTATSTPGSFTGTAAGSPIEVAGLTNGTSYTFTVYGMTDYGIQSASSAASNAVTPFAPPVYPPYGTLIAENQCSGYTLYNLRANGSGGTYQEILETNSTACGYQPPPPACTPYGTLLAENQCSGYTRYNVYANGTCGSYNVVTENPSTFCGYVPTPGCTCCIGYSATSARFCYCPRGPEYTCVWAVNYGIQYTGACGASGGSGVNCGGACVGCNCPAPFVVTQANVANGQGCCNC
jgi:hypothetical protein